MWRLSCVTCGKYARRREHGCKVHGVECAQHVIRNVRSVQYANVQWAMLLINIMRVLAHFSRWEVNLHLVYLFQWFIFGWDGNTNVPVTLSAANHCLMVKCVFEDQHVTPPPPVQATEKSQINTVPVHTVA